MNHTQEKIIIQVCELLEQAGIPYIIIAQDKHNRKTSIVGNIQRNQVVTILNETIRSMTAN